MSFTLKQLQHFIAITETGQISRAAVRCHVSQSSMTISLKNLEETLGTQLFTRHPNGLRLTESGERFLRHARTIASVAANAIDDLQEAPDKMAGRVIIGVTETITAYLIPALLNSVMRRFPHMEVRIVELAQPVLESQLIAGQFDFSILLVSNLNTGLDLEHETLIRSSRKLWVHPEHPLLAREQISLADVAREDYILLDMDEHVQTVGKYWGRFKLRPKVTYQSHSIEAVRSLVALGHGATILSDLVYRPWSLEGQRIVRRSITEDIPSMDVGIAWMGGRELSAPAKRVMEFLRSSMRQISERVY